MSDFKGMEDLYNQPNWYVVNTYSGYENKVKENLEKRIETMNMENQILRVIVPTEIEIEIKDGKRKEREKKTFPGYVLVEMIMTDEAWFVVRNTPNVTGFIGSHGQGAKPIPMLPWEVESLLNAPQQVASVEVDYEIDGLVQIMTGPFAEKVGRVKAIDVENEKVAVEVASFGREITVELELTDVQKEI